MGIQTKTMEEDCKSWKRKGKAKEIEKKQGKK